MTRIKICGITNMRDALAAMGYGADEIGLNFYPRSPRYITVECALRISDEAGPAMRRVGVFVNESPRKIVEIANRAGLNAIQLHGDEDALFIDDLRKQTRLPIIKAVRVKPGFDATELTTLGADAVLLDSFSGSERGGSGKAFDWSVARNISESVAMLYLAGGLTPENIGEAIERVKPYALDVCSGIEAEPGK